MAITNALELRSGRNLSEQLLVSLYNVVKKAVFLCTICRKNNITSHDVCPTTKLVSQKKTECRSVSVCVPVRFCLSVCLSVSLCLSVCLCLCQCVTSHLFVWFRFLVIHCFKSYFCKVCSKPYLAFVYISICCAVQGDASIWLSSVSTISHLSFRSVIDIGFIITVIFHPPLVSKSIHIVFLRVMYIDLCLVCVYDWCVFLP